MKAILNEKWLVALVLLTAITGTGCSGQTDDPCRAVDCSLRGYCQVVAGQPTCVCDPGYIALGLVCHQDWCQDLDCQKGECTQNVEFGVCQCEAGWTGALCDQCREDYHLDNGECVPDQPCDTDPCIHGKCRVEGEQEVCDCNAGYTGDTCDSCAEGFHPEGLICAPDQPDACNPNPCTAEHKTVCSLVGDSYSCACDSGYHDQDGQCVADLIDPCDPNPCQETNKNVCEISGQNFICHCNQGYHDENGSCVEDLIDPCDPNPCFETHRTTCTPDAGSFICSCDSGYHEQAGACLPDCDVDADLCSAAQASFEIMVSANGHSAVGYNISERKIDAFLEHVYRNWDADSWTRDLLFDSYLGIRTAGVNQWLNEVEPVRHAYLEQTGIIHVVHQVGELEIDSYVYSPWQLSRPAIVLIGRVTNRGETDTSGSIFTLHNYHLGATTVEEPVHPGFEDEQIQYQALSGAYLETGPAGMLLHRPLGQATHYGCTPANPWQALAQGQDLADTLDSGVGDDRVAGFQKDFSLSPGQAAWFGVVSAFDRFGDQVTLSSDIETAYGSMTAEQALQAALDEWSAWRQEPIDGLSAAELMIYRQSEAILRQAQVFETSDLSKGQIMASLPPGNWNICWMRDMAYAIVALARIGHLAEARDALEFVLLADSGNYQQDYVGVPYQVTITRYFGNGTEETDFNPDGPNIEFDGFGLFLWAMGEYLTASGDSSLLDDHWTVIKDKIASALVGLVDSETGLIEADSSIWEVHWNGNQKRYSYTSLAAARGLCSAALMAEQKQEAALATEYQNTAVAIRDAIYSNSVDNTSVLASSYEELLAGSGYYDMASVEAFNWLLFDPDGAVSSATLDMFENNLRVSNLRGCFRNDDGGWYDSQEWVFVDLRASIGNRLAGRTAVADRLLDWITAQALSNHGMIAELHSPDSSTYEGEIPMVGFGAGAYLLALLERQSPRPVEPACLSWESQ
ncbi:MAG: hypothetical protein JRJ87_18225 [Deltaproteobacteria bacterium]|nr:hypothetical protein [Deltaproteobacteria bacterium]